MDELGEASREEGRGRRRGKRREGVGGEGEWAGSQQ